MEPSVSLTEPGRATGLGVWRWPAAGLLMLVCAGLSYTRSDADLWGHLRFGLDLLRDGHLSSTDPYSFTQDRPWINHEWLSELQTGIAYAAGGVAGLALLKMILAAGAFWLIWRALAGVRLGVRFAALLFLFAATIHITSSLRPQVWTFLFLAILLRTLSRGTASTRTTLPLLFVIWANCHGGWIVGLGVLCAWTAGETVADRRVSLQRAVVCVACALATLANPYGWHLWEFIATTVRMERSIAEWQPIFSAGAPTWLPWVFTTGAVTWVLTRPDPTRWSKSLVLLMLAYASFRVMRLGSLYAESLLMLAGPALAAAWPVRGTLPAIGTTEEKLVARAMFLAMAVGAILAFRVTLTCLPVGGYWAPDLLVGQALDAARPGRIVTYFDWGQYALWHLSPRLRVSMDGRRETVYSDQRLKEHDSMVNGEDAALRTLAEWNPEYVWLPARSTKTRAWLVENGYRIDIETPRSFLAVRRDLPTITAASGSRSMTCFPG